MGQGTRAGPAHPPPCQTRPRRCQQPESVLGRPKQLPRFVLEGLASPGDRCPGRRRSLSSCPGQRPGPGRFQPPCSALRGPCAWLLGEEDTGPVPCQEAWLHSCHLSSVWQPRPREGVVGDSWLHKSLKVTGLLPRFQEVGGRQLTGKGIRTDGEPRLGASARRPPLGPHRLSRVSGPPPAQCSHGPVRLSEGLLSRGECWLSPGWRTGGPTGPACPGSPGQRQVLGPQGQCWPRSLHWEQDGPSCPGVSK